MAQRRRVTFAEDDLPEESCPDGLLAPSLELALKGCVAQLRALRGSGADEERALKLSLTSLEQQLQSLQEGQARHRALLLKVLPWVCQHLGTRDVLFLSSSSAAVRGCLGGPPSLIVPNLDAVPMPWPHEWGAFLLRVQLSSVRSIALPPAVTAYLLAEHSEQLGALEALRLGPGLCDCVDLAALQRLPTLRLLTVDARDAAEEALVRLAGLQLPPLREVRLEFFERCEHLLLAPRLIFRHCRVPERAVAFLCRELGCLRQLRFLDCELSGRSEQWLLAALEHDGSCLVSVEGGTTAADEASDEHRVVESSPSKEAVRRPARNEPMLRRSRFGFVLDEDEA